jgi:hypothetical protein
MTWPAFFNWTACRHDLNYAAPLEIPPSHTFAPGEQAVPCAAVAT